VAVRGFLFEIAISHGFRLQHGKFLSARGKWLKPLVQRGSSRLRHHVKDFAELARQKTYVEVTQTQEFGKGGRPYKCVTPPSTDRPGTPGSPQAAAGATRC